MFISFFFLICFFLCFAVFFLISLLVSSIVRFCLHSFFVLYQRSSSSRAVLDGSRCLYNGRFKLQPSPCWICKAALSALEDKERPSTALGITTFLRNCTLRWSFSTACCRFPYLRVSLFLPGHGRWVLVLLGPVLGILHYIINSFHATSETYLPETVIFSFEYILHDKNFSSYLFVLWADHSYLSRNWILNTSIELYHKKVIYTEKKPQHWK
jgi:hypothetical protein